MDDKEHILKTVKHIRGDLDDACRIDGLLNGLYDADGPIAKNWGSIGRDVREPIALIEVSLLTRLILALARMHDHWDTNSHKDRMCLAGIFARLENTDNADLKSTLLPTEGQKESYGMALKNWEGRKKAAGPRRMRAAFKAAKSGETGKIAENPELDKFNLDKLLKNQRDHFLAHNLNHKNQLGMHSDELRYILEMTVEIVEPLEKALTETSVRYSNTKDIWRRKSEAFWGRLSP